MSTTTSPAITRDNWPEFNASRVRDWSEANPQWAVNVGHSDDNPNRPRDEENDRLWLQELVGHPNCFEEFARLYNDSLATGLAAAPDFEPDSDVVALRAEIERLQAQIATLEHRTYRRYDPVMRPMFEHAARVAAYADFCQEYDRIAEAVGGPTRDELGTELTYEFNVDVELTRNVTITVTASGQNADDAWESARDDVGDYLDDYEFDDYDIRDWRESGAIDPEDE